MDCLRQFVAPRLTSYLNFANPGSGTQVDPDLRRRNMQQHEMEARKGGVIGRARTVCALMSLAGLLALPGGAALADGKDGTFPTAEQVGGEVYIEPIAPGKKLPTDFEAYDLNGNKIDFGKVIAGKRSLVVFFISAVPVSVKQLKDIETFVDREGGNVNLVFVNADTVGSALTGGPKSVIPNTVKTMHVIKKEENLRNVNMFVGPNDALSGEGLSTRLGIRGLPTSFLLSASGVVEKVFVGPQKWKHGDI